MRCANCRKLRKYIKELEGIVLAARTRRKACGHDSSVGPCPHEDEAYGCWYGDQKLDRVIAQFDAKRKK